MQNGGSPTKTRFAWSEMPPEVRTTVWASLALAAAGVVAGLAILYRFPSAHGNPVFFVQFVVHDLPGCLLSALIILIAAASYRWELVPLRALDTLDRHRRLVAAALVALLALGTLTVYRNHPLTTDEFSQFFQAKIFARGRIWTKYPPELLDWLLPMTGSFFRPGWKSGAVITGYWPGLSLLQAPFVLVGASWLLNPLLGAGTLLLIRRLAAKLYPDTNAPAWAMLLTLASPVFIVNAISYYAMPAQLFLNLLFTILVLKRSPRALVAAGFVGSLALLQKVPVPHVVYAIPWIVWLVARPGGLRLFFWLVIGYLPLSGMLGLGWMRLRMSLAEQTAARTSYQDPWRWLSILNASVFFSVVYARALAFLKLAAWAVPGLVILAALGAQRKWADRRIRVLVASALLTFFAYLFLRPTQGHGWGYRYFHGAWGTLPLLACGVVASSVAEGRRKGTPIAHLAATLAVLSLILLNGFRLLQVDDWMDRHLAQLPPLDAGRAQVCFIRPWEGSCTADLVQNDPFLRQRTLFLKSHGLQTEKPFMEKHFPNAVPGTSDPNNAIWLITAPRFVEGRDYPDWDSQIVNGWLP